MVKQYSDATKVRNWIDRRVQRTRSKDKTVWFSMPEIARDLGLPRKNVSAALTALCERHRSINFETTKATGRPGKPLTVYSASPDTISNHAHVVGRGKPVRRGSRLNGNSSDVNISHLLSEAVDVLAKVQEVLSRHG